MLSWVAVCILSMRSSFIRLICNRSVSLTYRVAERCCFSLELRQRSFAPCLFLPCNLKMHMLLTAHPAGAALLPWQSPWVLILMPPPVKDVDSLNPIWRKIFIFSIALSIDYIAVSGMPKARKTIEAIACAILLYQFEVSTNAIPAGNRACQVIS